MSKTLCNRMLTTLKFRMKSKDKTLVEIIETHLNDVISPLLQRFANAKILLTPQEMQVAGLVKDGKTPNLSVVIGKVTAQ